MNRTETCSAMVEKAFGWIVDNLSEFDPFKNGRPFEIKHGQKVGELAILVHAYVVLTGRRDRDEVQRMVTLLQTIQKNPEFTERLPRSPGEFILPVEVYACLHALGYEDLDQRSLIQRTLDAHFLDQTERLPHRMMDIASCLDWGGFDTPYPSLESLYPATILGRMPVPLLLDEDAIYALTHVIMFLYGFGVRQGVSIPERQVAELERRLSALLVIAAQEHHWDLLAELLLCWECIRLEATDIYERAWEMLLKVQNDNGTVPGPEWAQKLHNALEQPVSAESEWDFYFAHHYHTTLLSVIAGCLRVNRLKSAFTRLDSVASIGIIPEIQPDLPSDKDAQSKAGNFDFIKKSRQWLEGITDTLMGKAATHPEDYCRLLLGLWICDSVVQAPPEAFFDDAQRIGQRLVEAGSETELDWSKTPAILKLMAAALLLPQQIFVDFLHSEEGYLSQTARLLKREQTDDANDDLLMVDKRLLLQQMGLHPKPAQVDRSEVIAYGHALTLAASMTDIAALLQRVNSSTHMGIQRADLASKDAWLGDLLSGFAAFFLRKYDLIMGSQTLRSMSYLGIENDLFASGVSFLRLHQGLDGAFGFFWN